MISQTEIKEISMKKIKALASFDCLLCISESSASEAYKYLGIDQEVIVNKL